MPAGIPLTQIAPRTRLFDGARGPISRIGPFQRTKLPNSRASGDGELTFLGDPLEGLAGTLDAVLAVVTVGWKQADHLVCSARGRPRNIAGSKIDGRPNRKLVLQRPLHRRKRRPRHGPAAAADWKPCAAYSMRHRALASYIQAWQMRL